MAVFIIFIFVVITIIAVIALKGFDRVAGRGPGQIKDGMSQYNAAQNEDRIFCPYCAERIMRAAKKCPFCKSDIK